VQLATLWITQDWLLFVFPLLVLWANITIMVFVLIAHALEAIISPQSALVPKLLTALLVLLALAVFQGNSLLRIVHNFLIPLALLALALMVLTLPLRAVELALRVALVLLALLLPTVPLPLPVLVLPTLLVLTVFLDFTVPLDPLILVHLVTLFPTA
jgi:hypothetical protein